MASITAISAGTAVARPVADGNRGPCYDMPRHAASTSAGTAAVTATRKTNSVHLRLCSFVLRPYAGDTSDNKYGQSSDPKTKQEVYVSPFFYRLMLPGKQQNSRTAAQLHATSVGRRRKGSYSHCFDIGFLTRTVAGLLIIK